MIAGEHGRAADPGAGEAFDFRRFEMKDARALGTALGEAARGAGSVEEIATRLVRHLYEHARDADTGQQSCALVRLFKTHPFGALDGELQAVARRMAAGHPLAPAMRCLVLFGTAGDRPEWNVRRASAHHGAIPLASRQMVGEFPMISQLIYQLGLPVPGLDRPSPELVLSEERSCNVFHVPDAPGSPFVPDQASFVVPYGIQSVLGCGGWLPTGDIFAAILFSRTPVPARTAELFVRVAVAIRVALLPSLETAFSAP